MRTYKKNRKKRANTSYDSYKENIRKLEEKGYEIDKSDILSKKNFDNLFARLKASGKKNIARDLAKDLTSYQYSRYKKQIEKYEQKGWKLYEKLSKEKFAKEYQIGKRIQSFKKRGFGIEQAEAELMFMPSYAESYAREMIGSESYVGKYGPMPEPKKADVKKFAQRIMEGQYKPKDLFQSYIQSHDGYYYDENGEQHIRNNIREQFEALY